VDDSPTMVTELKRYSVRHSMTEVDNFLPLPVEYNAITGEMSKLRDNIKNHAQSYYHTSRVDTRTLDQKILQNISEVTGVPALRLTELLLNPRSRILAIRLYLAALIFSQCGTSRDEVETLLPKELSSFVPLIVDTDINDTGESLS